MAYVYIYLDPTRNGGFEFAGSGLTLKCNFEPFYVGKGNGNRLNFHFKRGSKNPLLSRRLEDLKMLDCSPRIKKIRSGLTDKDALCLEARLVSCIGRRSEGSGPLLNLTDGGDQPPPAKAGTRSKVIKKMWKNPDTRKKLSEARKKMWAEMSPEDKAARLANMQKAQKKSYNRPEKKKELSEHMKKQWQDPIFSQKARHAVAEANKVYARR